MERALQLTADGSHTLYVPALQVSYHSKHGAVQESRHVFIEAGLRHRAAQKKELAVLEMGLGTGLNALLTLQEVQQQGLTVSYHAIEAYPLQATEAAQLNYAAQLSWPQAHSLLAQLHGLPWQQPTILLPGFTFTKHQGLLQHFELSTCFDVIYYDAFAPLAQPELWTQAIFEKLLALAAPGACLVTYCSKGSVRRAMQAAGWQVSKLPGPPGKREMVRAFKAL